MSSVKVVLSPARFVNVGGVVRFDHDYAALERVVSDVEAVRGTIRARTDGNRVSVRLSNAADRFITTEHSSSIVWYADPTELSWLRWALLESKQAEEFFAC